MIDLTRYISHSFMTAYFPGPVLRHCRHIQRNLNFPVPSFDFHPALTSSFPFLAGSVLVIVLHPRSLLRGAGVGYFAFDDTLLETFSWSFLL